MKRKLLAGLLAALLTVSFSTASLVYAEEDVDTSKQQSQLDSINAEKAALQKELNQNNSTKKSLNNEIKNLEGKIAMSNLEIQEIGYSIAITESRINDALKQLDELEANIAQQNDDLNDRLRAMYKNGNVGFLDVLLGSASISDFMTNMDRIQRVYDVDKELLSQLETEHMLIKSQRDYLSGLQADLENDKQKEADKRNALEADKSVVNEKKAAVQNDINELSAQIDELNAEANALTAEILKLQGKGDFVGGAFTWPAPCTGRITSPFGYRLHPILKVNKLHTGIDIGCPANSDIIASNAGTVIKAAWNNSYGYMIMIDHGGGIVTLYAHNNKLLVKTGDVVYKGQVISKSGSTGQSTGPHLHFEVRVNGNYVDPTGYVTYGV